MVETEIIEKYFKTLDAEKLDQMSRLGALYSEWNTKINVISRKDIDNLYLHHILHSLSIIKFVKFNPGAEVLDLGTGGGFPGVPLAIIFPQVHFTLLDSRKKKLLVIDEVCKACNIKNITTVHQRMEEHKTQYDFIVSRAVTRSKNMISLCRKNLKKESTHGLPNGIIALKGGDLKEELQEIKQSAYYESLPLKDYFEEDYFVTKSLVYIQL